MPRHWENGAVNAEKFNDVPQSVSSGALFCASSRSQRVGAVRAVCNVWGF